MSKLSGGTLNCDAPALSNSVTMSGIVGMDCDGLNEVESSSSCVEGLFALLGVTLTFSDIVLEGFCDFGVLSDEEGEEAGGGESERNEASDTTVVVVDDDDDDFVVDDDGGVVDIGGVETEEVRSGCLLMIVRLGVFVCVKESLNGFLASLPLDVFVGTL